MGFAGKIVCPYPKVIVGVSGGVDSMTLADMLHRQGCVEFAVAHCNFHLRGEESDDDAEFVRNWCETKGVKFHHIDLDTFGYARSRKASIEMAARELRYGWFASLCREYGYGAVAIAHNANDNAETLILNLVRGTGLRGICGMQELSTQNVESTTELAAALGCPKADFPETLKIWRPLLGMTRDQIEGYAHKHGLSWREDRTNKDTEYKRNLIRNEIIPLLERLNPSAVKVLNRDMRHFSEAQSIVRSNFSNLNTAELTSITFNKSEGWRYLLYLFLEQYSFNSAVIAQIEDLLDSGRTLSGKTFYSPTHKLTTTSSSFILDPLDSDNARHRSFPRNPQADALQGAGTIVSGSDFGGAIRSCTSSGANSLSPGGVVGKLSQVDEFLIEAPGEYEIEGRFLSVELFNRPEHFELRQLQGVTIFDADKVPFPLCVRHWKNGDWLRPLGSKGRKKLSDLFTDLKFSLPQKHSALLLAATSNSAAVKPGSSPGLASSSSADASRILASSSSADASRILALLGRRIDDSVSVSPSTTRILRLHLYEALVNADGKFTITKIS